MEILKVSKQSPKFSNLIHEVNLPQLFLVWWVNSFSDIMSQYHVTVELSCHNIVLLEI
jgi:hypothetical protein